jgi:hypothetical protein
MLCPAPQAPAYLPMAKARGITQDLVIEAKNGMDRKARGAARWINDSLMLLWVEHFRVPVVLEQKTTGTPKCHMEKYAEKAVADGTTGVILVAVGVEQAVVSPAAILGILITATPVGRSCRGRTVHTG